MKKINTKKYMLQTNLGLFSLALYIQILYYCKVGECLLTCKCNKDFDEQGHFYLCHSRTWLVKVSQQHLINRKVPVSHKSHFLHVNLRKNFAVRKRGDNSLSPPPPMLRACLWYRINKWKKISQEKILL